MRGERGEKKKFTKFRLYEIIITEETRRGEDR